MASVSSGRSPATAGSTRSDLRRILGLRRHLDVDDLASAGGGLGLDRTRTHGDHRGVTGGLGLDGERATEDGVHAHCAVLDLDDVDEQTGAKARGQPAADLLAVGAGGQQHARRAGRLDQRRQHVDERRDQVVLRVVGLGDVDLGGAGRLQSVDQRRGRARLAHHDGGGLAQHTGGGDQFGADLLQRTFSVLDEHKYFSHVSSMSL